MGRFLDPHLNPAVHATALLHSVAGGGRDFAVAGMGHRHAFQTVPGKRDKRVFYLRGAPFGQVTVLRK